MAEAVDYQVLGTRPVRPDGVDKVTGRAQFGADQNLPNMLHGKILRSPHAHAHIKRVDLSKALAMDGVCAAVAGADFPAVASGVSIGEAGGDVVDVAYNVMARDKALYHGHAVAAVAATSLEIAEQALDAIDVEYEVLPPVLDVLQAMAPDAPLLDENCFTKNLPEKPDKPSNIASVMALSRGDVEAGFEQADLVVEGEYRIPMAHQGYIEPHACTATVNEEGKATVWCCTQGQFDFRTAIAKILDWKVGDMKVVPSEIGGGFGGKTVVYLEPVAVLLSQRAGRPVKMVMSREEVFRATGPTSGTVCRVKVGAKKNGRITAAKAWLAYESGAFPGAPVGPGAMSIFAPYDLENFLVEGHEVRVNKPKVAAYRAPGAPQSMHAMEVALDDLARQLNMDPLDLRMVNAADEGTQAPYGPKFQPSASRPALKRPRSTRTTQRRCRKGPAAASPPGFGSTSACSPAPRCASMRTARSSSWRATRTSAAPAPP